MACNTLPLSARASAQASAQSGVATAGVAANPIALPATPPPSVAAGVFPLDQVHRGLRGVAYTVFEGTQPEAMEVEILGILHNALGPGQDMILARLVGAKPEYTGVVAGMSGSPVYIDGKLLGALSYRIGQFSKEPIAGITPIEQMLQVRNPPVAPVIGTAVASAALSDNPAQNAASGTTPVADSATVQPIETPLIFSGFSPEAIKLWQDNLHTAGLTAMPELAAEAPTSLSPNPSFPDRQSARCLSAAIWTSRPPAPSPMSMRSSCWPAVIP